MVTPATVTVSVQASKEITKRALRVRRVVRFNAGRIMSVLPVGTNVMGRPNNLKVLLAIVRPVPVAVVDLLIPRQGTPKHLLRNQTMHTNLFAVVPLNLITASIFPHVNLQLTAIILHATLNVKGGLWILAGIGTGQKSTRSAAGLRT